MTGCATVHCALQFNDRRAGLGTRLLLAAPLYSATFLAHAFTLAVWLRETLQVGTTPVTAVSSDTSSLVLFTRRSYSKVLGFVLQPAGPDPASLSLLALAGLAVLLLTNLLLFRLCGQDWPRSVIFSAASLLLPAGHCNDPQYYQLPGQDIVPVLGAVATETHQDKVS